MVKSELEEQFDKRFGFMLKHNIVSEQCYNETKDFQCKKYNGTNISEEDLWKHN